MKRLIEKWDRRRRRGTQMLVFRLDRPRRIDRIIDYFGERLTPVMAQGRARRKS